MTLCEVAGHVSGPYHRRRRSRYSHQEHHRSPSWAGSKTHAVAATCRDYDALTWLLPRTPFVESHLRQTLGRTQTSRPCPWLSQSFTQRTLRLKNSKKVNYCDDSIQSNMRKTVYLARFESTEGEGAMADSPKAGWLSAGGSKTRTCSSTTYIKKIIALDYRDFCVFYLNGSPWPCFLVICWPHTDANAEVIPLAGLTSHRGRIGATLCKIGCIHGRYMLKNDLVWDLRTREIWKSYIADVRRRSIQFRLLRQISFSNILTYFHNCWYFFSEYMNKYGKEQSYSDWLLEIMHAIFLNAFDYSPAELAVSSYDHSLVCGFLQSGSW